MTAVLCNASPLMALGKLNWQDLIAGLFGQDLIAGLFGEVQIPFGMKRRSL